LSCRKKINVGRKIKEKKLIKQGKFKLKMDK